MAAGQVLAMMDTRDLEASLKKSQALVSQAERALEEAGANLAVQQTQVTLAHQELDRTGALSPKALPQLKLDQRRRQMNAAVATQLAATQKVAEAEHALEAGPTMSSSIESSSRTERGCRSARLHSRQRPYLMARPAQLGRQIEEMKAHHSRGRAAPADQQ